MTLPSEDCNVFVAPVGALRPAFIHGGLPGIKPVDEATSAIENPASPDMVVRPAQIGGADALDDQRPGFGKCRRASAINPLGRKHQALAGPDGAPPILMKR
jgi:hypothetical protein